MELTRNGKISRGILLVDMNFSGIDQLFIQVNSSNSGYVYLVDGNGEIIYHPNQSLINSNLINENNMIAATYSEGTHEEEFEGENRMVTVRMVGYTGWKIVSVTKTNEFFMSYNQTRLFTLIIITLTIILIIFANQFVSYLIGNPLKKLDNSVKDDDIFIDVIDNGLGMPEDMVQYLLTDENRVHKKGSGTGVINVHKRIQLYFGMKYGLEIESELDEGTIIHIHLPKILYDNHMTKEDSHEY